MVRTIFAGACPAFLLSHAGQGGLLHGAAARAGQAPRRLVPCSFPIERSGPCRRQPSSAPRAALFATAQRAAAQDLPPDWGQDLKWFEAAAGLGNAEAQYRLGLFLEQGVKRAPDPIAARRWYQRAAEQDHASAQFRLAALLQTGAAGAADPAGAAVWYRAAAEQNMAPAQYNLAIMLERGLGIPAEPAAAAGYYQAAARNGVGEAAANLGLMYLDGRGVAQDRVMALAWLTLAVEAGTPGAAATRDELIAGLGEVERQQVADRVKALKGG